MGVIFMKKYYNTNKKKYFGHEFELQNWKDDSDQQKVCGAPIRWSKYTSNFSSKLEFKKVPVIEKYAES